MLRLTARVGSVLTGSRIELLPGEQIRLPGQTLGYTAFHGWNTGRNAPKTVRTQTLSVHKLIT